MSEMREKRVGEKPSTENSRSAMRKNCAPKPSEETNPPNVSGETDATLAEEKEPDLLSELMESEKRRWITEAAYYKAEARGFEPGYEEQDWIEAEKEYEASNPGE